MEIDFWNEGQLGAVAGVLATVDRLIIDIPSKSGCSIL